MSNLGFLPGLRLVRRLLLLITLGSCCALLPSRPARAAEDAFQYHYDAAIQAFLAERYAESLQHFQAAYATRQLPRLLINIGTVHRKLGQARQALEAYETYLRIEPEPSPQVRAKLDELLAQTRALLAASSPAAPSAGKTGTPSGARGKPRTTETRPPDRLRLVELPLAGTVDALAAGEGDEVWVARDSRILHHRDGRWRTAYQPWQSRSFAWIGELKDGSLWAAGDQGALLSWDGQAWHEVLTGIERSFLCLWQDGERRVHALDRRGGLLRLEGTEWLDVDTGWSGTVWLHACSVAPGGDVWAVGAQGMILRWDGSSLRGLPGGSAENLLGVWAGPAEVLAVGEQGTVLRWDGKNFGAQPTPEPRHALAAVGCAGADSCWAAGGTFRKDEAGRIRVEGSFRGNGLLLARGKEGWVDARGSSAALLFALWARSPQEIWAVGREGTTLRFDGSWALLPPAGFEDLYSLHGSTAGTVWAAGSAGTVVHHDGQRWQGEWNRPDRPIKALARAADGSLWAAGDRGLLLHGTDGTRHFRTQDTGSTHSLYLTQLGISPRGQVCAAGSAGNDGSILVREGSRWVMEKTGVPWTLAAFHAAEGERWATAAGGACQMGHAVGRTWTRLDLSTLPVAGSKKGETVSCACTLSALWSSSPRDVWAAGCKGTLVHWDGERWEFHRPGKEWAELHLSALAGRGPEQVWAVGYSTAVRKVKEEWVDAHPPVILRWDGRRWRAFPASQHYSALALIPGSEPPEAWVRTAAGSRLGRIVLP